MHDAESRALGRAAVLLLVISALRWALGHVGAEPDAAPPSVLPELAAEAAEAKEEAERRSRPLEPGERIDVNRASAAELDRLPGVGPALAGAIVEARETGGGFRDLEDLERVRGIGPAMIERMRERVAVGPAPAGVQRLRAGAGSPPARDAPPPPVDLNRAGLEELQTLPGIGPALAERILARRRERPFSSVDDLLDVRGIGPATLERLRARASVSASR